MKEKLVRNFVISTFVVLYAIVSIISTIHVIDFFEMSNPYWLAVSLAIAFEFGAAASLASLIALDKMNKTIVWILFFTITAMQMQGNMYYAFKNLQDFQSWSELFNIIEEDVIYQKRILAFVSGAILPLVALGFIKSLVDYIKPEPKVEVKEIKEDLFDDLDIEEEDEDLEDDFEGSDIYTEQDFKDLTDEEVDQIIEEFNNSEEFYVEPEVKEEPVKENPEFELGKNLFKNQVESLAKSKPLQKRVVEESTIINQSLADQLQQAKVVVGGAELKKKPLQ